MTKIEKLERKAIAKLYWILKNKFKFNNSKLMYIISRLHHDDKLAIDRSKFETLPHEVWFILDHYFNLYRDTEEEYFYNDRMRKLNFRSKYTYLGYLNYEPVFKNAEERFRKFLERKDF